MVKGAVPGSKGGWVTIKDAVKKATPDNVILPAALRSGGRGRAEAALQGGRGGRRRRGRGRAAAPRRAGGGRGRRRSRQAEAEIEAAEDGADDGEAPEEGSEKK